LKKKNMTFRWVLEGGGRQNRFESKDHPENIKEEGKCQGDPGSAVTHV